MATVQITLTDTPTGGVAVHTDFKPAVGQACTAAQGHALEIMARTRKQWGVDNTSKTRFCHHKSDLLIKNALGQWQCTECNQVVIA